MARPDVDLGMMLLHEASRVDARLAEVVSGAARVGEPMRLPRLFRRLPGLRYRGLVHETVDEWLSERGGVATDVAADIVHLGGIPEVRAARGKDERNLRLMELRCRMEPGSIVPIAFLAAHLYQAGRIEEAAEAVERGWAIRESQPRARSVHLLAVLRAQVASASGLPEVVLETAAEAERREGPTSDLRYLAGCALELQSLRVTGEEARRKLAAAVEAYRVALLPRQGESAFRVVPGSSCWAARVRLGTALLRLGEPGPAAEQFRAAAAKAPDPLESRLGEAEAMLDGGDAPGAIRALMPLLGPRPDGWILAAAASLAAGGAGVARDLLAGAEKRLGAGLVAPHRVARARALAGALA
jgi:tetratricopeptide (TPR) repeat protein